MFVVLDCYIQVLLNNITWCIICVVMYILVSGLILIVYVLPPVNIYIIHVVNINVTYTPYILNYSCEIYPQLDENFWGVYAYVLYHMHLMCMVKYVI